MTTESTGPDPLTMFMAGAYSAVAESGMPESEKRAFVMEVCKEAASRRYRYEDDEDDDDTWWSRNKGWALPLGVGLGMFLVGADAARNTRPDRNIFASTGGLWLRRLGRFLGLGSSDPLYPGMTEARNLKEVPRDINKYRDMLPAARPGTMRA